MTIASFGIVNLAGRRRVFPAPLCKPTHRSLSALVPGRGRNSRSKLLRPDHYLLAVLPLDSDCFVPDLEPALVNSEVAQNSLGLERKQDFPELIRVRAPSPLYCCHKELAPCVRIGRLDGGSTVEFLLIRRDELLISGVWKASLPKRAAVDEFSLLSEPLMVSGRSPYGRLLNILTLRSISFIW